MTRARLILLAIAAVLHIPAEVVADSAPHARSVLLGGIQVNEPDHGRWTAALSKAGLNTVEVTVYAKQGDWDTDHLWFEKTDDGVVREVRAAKSAGLKVVLILRVALDHAFPRNKFLWHGMISPRTEDQVRSWFRQYTRFVDQWARIARDEKIDLLVIGSEMNALSATAPVDRVPDLLDYFARAERQQWERDRTLKFQAVLAEKHLWVRGFDNYDSLPAYLDDKIAINQAWARQVTFGNDNHATDEINQRRRLLDAEWRTLIGHTRNTYRSPLSYAANFDNYMDVGFWDALDVIGINAYFPLRRPDQPATEAVLEAGWTKVFDEINAFKVKQDLAAAQPVLFTELGYLFRRDTTIQPWAGFGFSVVGTEGNERLIAWNDQPIDPGERARAVRALRRVVHDRDEPLAGILYWKLSTQPAHREIEPFVLVIGTDPPDPLETELREFGD